MESDIELERQELREEQEARLRFQQTALDIRPELVFEFRSDGSYTNIYLEHMFQGWWLCEVTHMTMQPK